MRVNAPRSVEELDGCFMVRDHNGQQLAYLYFEERAGAAISGEVA
jgi:hypothetical protein